MANAASTGFEGIQDAMAFEVAQEESRLARQFAAQAQLDGFGQFQMALSGGLNALVDRFRPSIAQRTAQAVTTARSNAMKAVEGEEYDSPYLRQVAVLERTAEELEGQGLSTTAEKLRANALALRTQAVEFQRLQYQTAKDQGEAILVAAKVPFAEDMAADEAGEQRGKRRKAEVDARVAEETADDLIAQASLQTEADEADLSAKVWANTTGRELEIRRTNAAIAASNASAAASADAIEARRLGKPETLTLSDGSIVQGRVLPNGMAVVTERDPRTGQVSQRTLAGNEFVSVTVTGGRNEVASSEQRQLRDRAGSTISAINNIAAVRRILVESGGQSGLFVGKASQALARARTEGRAAVEALGGAEAVQANDALVASFIEKNAAKLDELEQAGVRRDVLEAVFSSLAYSIAGSREGGRLTNQDVEMAGVAAGLGASTTTGRLAAMDNLAWTMNQDVRDRLAMSNMDIPEPLRRAARQYGQEFSRAPVPNPANRDLDNMYRKIAAARARRAGRGSTVNRGRTQITIDN